MTRSEARKFVKYKAPNLYHGTALALLSHLVDSSFGPEGVRTITVKDSTLAGWVRIGERQLIRLLDRFTKDGVANIVRKENKITVRMDLSPLAALPEKLSEKKVKADRAQKAREVYAQEKEAREYARFVKQHFEMLEADNQLRTSYSETV